MRNRISIELGGGEGTAYMSTPVDSMLCFRDVFRAFRAGRGVLGPDVPLELAKQANRRPAVTELLWHRCPRTD